MQNTNNTNSKIKYAVIPFEEDGTPEDQYYWDIYESRKEAIAEAIRVLTDSEVWHTVSVADFDDDLCEVVNEEHTINLTKGIPTFAE